MEERFVDTEDMPKEGVAEDGDKQGIQKCPQTPGAYQTGIVPPRVDTSPEALEIEKEDMAVARAAVGATDTDMSAPPDRRLTPLDETRLTLQTWGIRRRLTKRTCHDGTTFAPSAKRFSQRDNMTCHQRTHR